MDYRPCFCPAYCLSGFLKATFLPPLSFDRTYITTVVAIIGTFLTPFIFFWQADAAIEERKAGGLKTMAERSATGDLELSYSAKDINVGMGISTLISYAIVLTTAANLHAHGTTQIATGAQAAEALKPLAGSASGLLFVLGMISAGLITVPVLASSTGFMFAQLHGWPHGLNEKWSRAKGFYSVIVASTVLGVVINFIGINPMSALFWASVIGGGLSPVLLLLVMLLIRKPGVVRGKPPRRITVLLGWAATVVTFCTTIAMIAVNVM